RPTAPIYTSLLSLHDALPICTLHDGALDVVGRHIQRFRVADRLSQPRIAVGIAAAKTGSNSDFLDKFREGTPTLRIDCALLVFKDRKSTRLNSSHQIISYAVF